MSKRPTFIYKLLNTNYCIALIIYTNICINTDRHIWSFQYRITTTAESSHNTIHNTTQYNDGTAPDGGDLELSDDIFRCIFMNENVWISIKFSLNIVPDGPINNIPALVQIMAWCQLGDKPVSEPMMVLLLKHICVTRPQWVNAKEM